MTFKKVKTGMLITCLILLLFGVGYAVSYLTDADTAINKTSIGSSNIVIEEEFPTPEPIEKGSVYTKKVCVKNEGPNDCFVRIKAVFSTSDIANYADVDWNEDDYAYNPEDGYWYYKEPITAGEKTTWLFTEVSLSEDIPSSYLADFDIIVYAESYMADGYTSYTNAWDDFSTNQ